MHRYRLTILFAVCAMLFISAATLIVNRVIIHSVVDGVAATFASGPGQEGLRFQLEIAKADILRATVGTMGGLFLALLGFIIVADTVIHRASRREVDLVEKQLAERKRWEAELLQAQKMECVGRLAGGVAHDFNNLLTPIIGYAELTEMGLKSDDPLRPNLAEILKAAETATHLTRQLLAFSRRQIIAPETVEINHLVDSVGQLLQRLIGEDIELEIHLNPDAGSVQVEPGQLEQVLINFAVNARDAMPLGGCLVIETGVSTVPEASSDRNSDVAPGDYVLLSVSDTGIGMSEEVRNHIFEPFFTTKGSGKGTGLGLSTCYGIIKQSGGHLTVDSEEGRGTSFKVYLPRVATEPPTADRDTPEADQLPQGRETVLLAEDEPSVRGLTSMMLRRQGYHVLEASNGVEALGLAEELASGEIHLLLTDVVMPHMGGRELAAQLQAIHPETRVLYTSGYTNEAARHHGLEGKGAQFIQKPFSPPDLARKVREVLDSQQQIIGPLGMPIDFNLRRQDYHNTGATPPERI